MTVGPSTPPRTSLLTAGRWGSGTDARASLRMRRHLGDSITLAHDRVRLTAHLPGDTTGLLLDATMTALPSRRNRRILGAEMLTSTVRMVRRIGVAPGIWRAPAMVTIAGVTDLVKVDVAVTMRCTPALRPALDVTLTVLGDARVFGIARTRGIAGPLALRLHAILSEPPTASSLDVQPWAYAA